MSNTNMTNKIVKNAPAKMGTCPGDCIKAKSTHEANPTATKHGVTSAVTFMLKRGVLMLLIIATLLSLASCTSREQTYCELGFTLPRGFVQLSAPDDFDLAFENGNQVIGVRRLSFGAVLEDGMLTTHSPERFAEIYRERIGVNSASDVFMHGDVPYFIYTLYSGGTYTYMPTFYRTPYAYFIITFICKNEMNEGTRVKFLGVCDSVYILPQYL